MDDLLKHIGVGGGAGAIGILLSWLGFKSRIDNMTEDLSGLKKRVRFSDTCLAMYEGIDKRLTNIEAMQKETRSDIKKLLARNGIQSESHN